MKRYSGEARCALLSTSSAAVIIRGAKEGSESRRNNKPGTLLSTSEWSIIRSIIKYTAHLAFTGNFLIGVSHAVIIVSPGS